MHTNPIYLWYMVQSCIQVVYTQVLWLLLYQSPIYTGTTTSDTAVTHEYRSPEFGRGPKFYGHHQTTHVSYLPPLNQTSIYSSPVTGFTEFWQCTCVPQLPLPQSLIYEVLLLVLHQPSTCTSLITTAMYFLNYHNNLQYMRFYYYQLSIS